MISQIDIEMNYSLEVINRTGYTILDILSDIGGIQGILISVFSIILAIFNYKFFDSYIASRLYKLQRPDAGDVTKYKKEIHRSTFFTPTKTANVLEYLVDQVILSCLICCSKTR